ncbi:MAG: roadblock/LC7 domain-containing protein [Candidatus Zixiibacteriota bacterium]
MIPIVLVLIIVTLIAIIIIINSGKNKKDQDKDKNNNVTFTNGNTQIESPGLQNQKRKLSETRKVNLPRKNGKAMDLEAELEKLKQQKHRQKSDISNISKSRMQAYAQQPKKEEDIKSSRKFLPLDESGMQNTSSKQPETPDHSKIPDNMFKQSTLPEDGILAIPYKLTNVDGVFASVLFDNSGLPISHANNHNIDKETISAYSAESLRVVRKLGDNEDSQITWFSAWFDEYIMIVIMKYGMGCTILLDKNLLDKNSDLMHISSLAKSVIEELTSYSPKEYA